jgi:TonB family protein
MMSVPRLIVAATLFCSVPALAQVPNQQSAQNASNWDIFLKLYPKRALEAREEGAVGFTVTLDSQGQVAGCQVTHSSGHPLLDQETCKLITLNAQFKPDSSIGPSQTRVHEGIINWRLPNSTAVLSAPVAVASTAAPEKIVCKKTPKTGSLASFERTCMTPTQWAKQSDDAKDMWADIQGKKGSTHGD